ncbi:ScbA/BarX family gamma-butyrolactone biosynthesis protein [Streptomyces sp. NPDC003077]|uniref:ScbA/BarX family gamma-butyrolactone biosynthesis protein n=1 Tax=Streptomyces sp. NPDC003077 TaxID=3154443 RepID=UPI0033BDFD4B
MLVTTERPAISRPALTTTVAKEYVHRAALSEVFLTGWYRTGDDEFVVTAQWPRSHSFYATEHGLHDPLLLCETVRQTFPLLSHAAYDVPFGHQLSWSHFRYSVSPQAMRVANTPAEIELHVRCSDIRYRRDVLASMSMRIEAVRNGSQLAVADTHFGCHTPKVYERLRAGGRGNVAQMFASAPAPTAPVPHSLVGRDRHKDVVLTPTQDEHRWQLRVDPTHPVLFDHPVDHVPGMLLLESVRQAAHALTPTTGLAIPTAMDVTFNRYVEFDAPCWIEAEPAPPSPEGDDSPRSVRINAVQSGTSAFTATTELTEVPAP